MKDIHFDKLKEKLKNKEISIKEVSATEKQYDYFRIECNIDGEYYRIVDRNGRFEDLTDTIHTEDYTKFILKEIGFENTKLNYTFIHNPELWDNDCGDVYDNEFDGYYGDGLDQIEELYYMD